MLRGAKNTVQGAKMAFGTPFLATPFGVALTTLCGRGVTFFNHCTTISRTTFLIIQKKKLIFYSKLY